MSHNPQNSIIYSQMSNAYEKYGCDIYNMSIKKLGEEFGEDVFPKWIARFLFPEPHLTFKNDHLNMELWKITESFCGETKYLGATVGYENFLTQDEKAYFMDFVEALKYRDDWYDCFKLRN